MVAVARIYRDALSGRTPLDEAEKTLREVSVAAPQLNGFLHGSAGRS